MADSSVNLGGRPLKYKTVEELQAAIDEYFKYCDNRIQQVYSPKAEAVIEVINPAPYTMSGLALAIGMDRRTLLDYSKRDPFLPTIKAAREKVHADVETRLMEKQATGAIFNLKNNFGWVDQTHTDLTTAGKELPAPILGGAAMNELPAHDSDKEAP